MASGAMEWIAPHHVSACASSSDAHRPPAMPPAASDLTMEDQEGLGAGVNWGFCVEESSFCCACADMFRASSAPAPSEPAAVEALPASSASSPSLPRLPHLRPAAVAMIARVGPIQASLTGKGGGREQHGEEGPVLCKLGVEQLALLSIAAGMLARVECCLMTLSLLASNRPLPSIPG